MAKMKAKKVRHASRRKADSSASGIRVLDMPPDRYGRPPPGLDPFVGFNAKRPFSYMLAVVTSAGHWAALDSAFKVMDKTLLQYSVDAMIANRGPEPDLLNPDVDPQAKWDYLHKSNPPFDGQWIWNDYCRRHLEKYGAPFPPDVDANWKRKSRPIGG